MLESTSGELSSDLSLELRELYRRRRYVLEYASREGFFCERSFRADLFREGASRADVSPEHSFRVGLIGEGSFRADVSSDYASRVDLFGEAAFRAEVSSDRSFPVDRFREDGFGKGDVLLFRLSCVIQGNVLYAVEWLRSRCFKDWYFNRVGLRLSSSAGSSPLS